MIKVPMNKTEAREAYPGEKVIIVNADPQQKQTYRTGDVLRVRGVFEGVRGSILVEGQPLYVSREEYRVITDESWGDNKVDLTDKPLVFVQHSDKPGDFTLYQDGKELRGIRSFAIDGGYDDATTHEVEYLTGKTGGK